MERIIPVASYMGSTTRLMALVFATVLAGCQTNISAQVPLFVTKNALIRCTGSTLPLFLAPWEASLLTVRSSAWDGWR